MTAPRQPRQWNAGDAEPPADVKLLRYERETLARRYLRRLAEDRWVLEAAATAATPAWSMSKPWDSYANKTRFWGSLVEVLPETPEPPHEAVQFAAEALEMAEAALPVANEAFDLVERTTRTDPVGTVREHDDGSTAVKVSMGSATGKGQHVWCWMKPNLEVRWLHHYEVAEWDIVPAPQSSSVPLLPLSAPVETEGQVEGRTEALSPQSETELKLWNLLDKAEQEYLAGDEPCDRKSALVRAVLAEGWRPPLPATKAPGYCPNTMERADECQCIECSPSSPLPADEVTS